MTCNLGHELKPFRDALGNHAVNYRHERMYSCACGWHSFPQSATLEALTTESYGERTKPHEPPRSLNLSGETKPQREISTKPNQRKNNGKRKLKDREISDAPLFD